MSTDAVSDATIRAAGMTPPQGAMTDDLALLTGLPPAPPPLPPTGSAAPASAAQSAHNRIVQYIRSFEQQLNSDQEVAMGFAASDAGVLRIEGLGYFEPDLITFYGRDDAGNKTQLVQHVTQISVMLRAVPKDTPDDAPARRIGFHLQAGWRGGDAGDASA